MLTIIGKILPFFVVEKLIKKFGHDFATLKLGSKEIKGKFWLTGSDEGFFISDLTEMKEVARRQREKLEEYEEKISRLEDQE